MNNPLISILTPTYNRGKFLERIYNSLKIQSNNNFEWIIIDDGSSDNTKDVINRIINNRNNFKIQYLEQNNGGKHRAINNGIKYAKGDWTIILDSDDWFSSSAIAEITSLTKEVNQDKSICSVTALRVTPDNKTIGTECNYQKWDTTFFNYRYIYKIKGDRAEIVRTNILKRTPFPEFSNENFLAEGILWNKLSEKYKTRFVSNKFYICEYQEGGLTDTFKSKMESNPLGSMANQLSIIKQSNCPIKYFLLASYLYYRYRKIALDNNNNIPKELHDSPIMRLASILNPLISLVLKLK